MGHSSRTNDKLMDIESESPPITTTDASSYVLFGRLLDGDIGVL